MNSTTDDPRSSSRRIGAMALIIFLSLAMPIGIVAWSVKSALAGKPLGLNLAEFNEYEFGVIKNGELWFTVYRPPADASTPSYETRIKRMNLKTGKETETGLFVKNDSCWMVLFNDQVLAVSSYAIFRCDPTVLVRIAAYPPRSKTFSAALFTYDGRLTTVVETDDGGFRLLHLTDGEWVDGRKILLPGSDRVWDDDPQSDRRTLLPITSQQPASTTPIYWTGLLVASQQQQIHLVLQASNGFHAYRTGFEFADEDEPTVSALRPENAPQESSGWKPIPFLSGGDNFSSMKCDRHGLLLASWNNKNPSQVHRRNNDGTWSRVQEPDSMSSYRVPSIYVDADNGGTFLIDGDQQWSFAQFYPIEGNRILPPQFTFSTGVHEYLARWRQLFAGLLFGWLVHQTVLIGGIQLLSRRGSDDCYEFGSQRVMLASVVRRALSLSIDLLLLLVVLACVLWAPLQKMGLLFQTSEEINVCRCLWNIESVFFDRIGSDPNVPFGSSQPRFDRYTELSSTLAAHFYRFATVALVLCCVKLYVEGRFGITPGKWLLRIRTVRTTLRLCGFSRAIVRDTVCGLDIPLFLTALPAAISMMLSKNQQRLGDRLADTVVVSAASLRSGDRVSQRRD